MTHPLIDTLAQARKAAGLTQADLAERSGLSRMTVQRQEGGQLDPRLSTLHEMGRTLGLELIAVPASLTAELQAFIQSGGRFLAQPTGVEAPPSVVDQLGKPG
jgi:transcriptional regulator with XRE-family HTH domain